jgi:type II secretory pathway pseudopilin PulG
MLVAMGIAALLMSLALPAVMKARNSAKRTAIFYQLQMISTGLEAYRQDFNTYPQADLANTQIPDTGAFALCRALFSPAPATGSVTALFDNHTGPGFKMGTTGKVYGPYLAPDNFRFGYATVGSDGVTPELSPTSTNFTATDWNKLVIADRTDKPILYVPAATAKPRFQLPNGDPNPKVFFAACRPATGVVTDTYYYDLTNITGGAANPVIDQYRALIRQPGETDDTMLIRRLQRMLGDSLPIDPAPPDGRLQNGEKPAIDAPFVLWSPGVDATYGKVGVKNPDDVIFTNFGQ